MDFLCSAVKLCPPKSSYLQFLYPKINARTAADLYVKEILSDEAYSKPPPSGNPTRVTITKNMTVQSRLGIGCHWLLLFPSARD